MAKNKKIIIKRVFVDVFQDMVNGIVVFDEKDRQYRMNTRELENILKGREIIETKKSRVYEHILKIK